MSGVTVAIPLFNATSHLVTLRRVIESQTQPPDEVIVYDDGSADDTLDLSHAWARADSRIRVIEGGANRGRGYARQRLLDAVRTPCLAWLDADDRWAPEALAQQVRGHAIASANHDPAILILSAAYSQINLRAGGEKIIRLPRTYDRSAYQFLARDRLPPVMLQTTFGEVAAYRRGGGFDETMNWSEDFEFFLRHLAAGGVVAPNPVTDRPLTFYFQSLEGRDPRRIEAAHAQIKAKHGDFWGDPALMEEEFALRRLRYVFYAWAVNGGYGEARAIIEGARERRWSGPPPTAAINHAEGFLAGLLKTDPDAMTRDLHARANRAKRFRCRYLEDRYVFDFVGDAEAEIALHFGDDDGHAAGSPSPEVRVGTIEALFFSGVRTLKAKTVRGDRVFTRRFSIEPLVGGAIRLLPA